MKRSPSHVFFNVLQALFLREVQTRFGTQSLGYFWALFDAMLMVLVFAGLKSLIAENTMQSLDFPVFLATGFLAFFLFKNIVTKSMGAFSSNAALFSYIQVKPIDTIIARVLVEVFVSIMATLAFIAIGLFFEFDISIENFNMVIFSLVWLCLFAFSIGLFSAVIGSFYATFTKIINIIMMPLLFVSALMYTVESLPPALREIILYNPLVHFIEMLHGYYFLSLTTHYVNYEYMFFWTVLPLFFALLFYIRAEKKIIAS